MNTGKSIKRAEIGYMLLIFITMAQELLVYLKVYADQSYSTTHFLFSLGILAALLAGFFLPMGVAVVGVFVFLVSYFVYLAAFADLDFLKFAWIFILPANVIIAAFIKKRLIRSKRILERIEELKAITPQIDLDTTLGNRDALADTLVKQANLANRYSEQYTFSLAMFKIEFLPLVMESLGSARYAQLLKELSGTIQAQIRFEDYKFSIDGGRFIVLLPMTRADHVEQLSGRIKQAIMNVQFEDKHGRQLKLVIRAGSVIFQQEQFSQYMNLDQVLATLERRTETDVIGEYI
ncbi:GGDEF domain-containing protein [Paenibacillaceae bacterium]|nr:GGDEF domain-containing protein [Paenibacillaceae bacterium]